MSEKVGSDIDSEFQWRFIQSILSRHQRSFKIQSRCMPDPPFSDIDFKNKMALIWTTLKTTQNQNAIQVWCLVWQDYNIGWKQGFGNPKIMELNRHMIDFCGILIHSHFLLSHNLCIIKCTFSKLSQNKNMHERNWTWWMFIT